MRLRIHAFCRPMHFDDCFPDALDEYGCVNHLYGLPTKRQFCLGITVVL